MAATVGAVAGTIGAATVGTASIGAITVGATPTGAVTVGMAIDGAATGGVAIGGGNPVGALRLFTFTMTLHNASSNSCVTAAGHVSVPSPLINTASYVPYGRRKYGGRLRSDCSR